MTTWSSVLVVLLSVYLHGHETTATLTADPAFTVSNCPRGIGYMPIIATGDGTATWVEPTAISSNGGANIIYQSHVPGVTTFTNQMSTQVTYQWQDTVGKLATCNFWIRLQPAGVISTSCPGSPVAPVVSAAPAQVTWPEPTAISTNGATVNAAHDSPTHTSGSLFDAGDTVVEYYWIDTNGNYASCIFTVRVTLDTTAPGWINCPPSVTYAGDMASWTNPTASDANPVTVSCDRTSPHDLTNGDPATVTCTATDAAGNTADCTWTVMSVFAISNCPASPIMVVSRSAPATASWTPPTATSLIDASSPTLTSTPPSPGSSFNAGHTSVTYTWEDNSGNTASCVFTVTVVLDTTNPTWTNCPPSVTYAGDMAYWLDPVATDANSATVSCNRTSPYDLTNGDPATVTCTATDAAGNTADCTWTVATAAPDLCNPNPCQNNGVCMSDGTCDCTGTGNMGETCNVDINECSNSTLNTCDSNAICTNTDGGYMCMCLDGYFGNGEMCQDIDECTVYAPCQNGATCTDLDGSYSCSCTSGWEGKNCGVDIDECAVNNPCLNGATCMNEDGSYRCICSPGYEGNNCDINIDECVSAPCQNGGTCEDGINEFTCQCGSTGYMGDTCEEDINECTSLTNPHNCDPDATCMNYDGGYDCECDDGYSGDGFSCTMCSSGSYGVQCSGMCICITGAVCYHVDGTCTCDESDQGFDCNRANIDVTIQMPEPVLDGDNVNLTCQVNLPRSELQDQNVIWIITPNGKGSTTEPGVPIDPDTGLYILPLKNAQPNVTSGTYTCIANSGGYAALDEYELDVKAPGRIINGDVVAETELAETVDFDCTVYGNTNPMIAWYGLDGNEIDGSGDKYDIIESSQPDKLFTTKVLRIKEVARVDNGTYMCNITNTINVQSDETRFDSGDYELVVLERPEITIPTAIAISAFEIEVEWMITFIGNSKVTNCTIGYRIPPDGFLVEDVIMAPVEIPYNITGLTPYKDYEVQVTCTNDVDDSETKLVDRDTRTRQSNPTKPIGVTAVPEMETVAIVRWLDPISPNGPIQFYNVTLEGPESSITVKTEGKQQVYRFENLTPGASYNVFVRAFNVEDGIELPGELSDMVILEMPPARPSEPRNAEASDSDNQCTVTWEVPEQTYGVITHYMVYWMIRPRTDLDTGVGDIDGEGSQRVEGRLTYQKSLDSLVEYSRYEFKVSASTSAGEGLNATAEGYCYTSPGVQAGATVPPPEGPNPDDPKSITSSTFQMTIAPVTSRLGNVGCYEIVVIEIDEDNGVPSKPPAPEDVKDYESCRAVPGCAYAAMVLNESELNDLDGEPVSIGNKGRTTCNDEDALLLPSRRRRRAVDSKTREAYNGNLRAGKSYTAFTRAYIPTGNGQSETVSSPLIDPVVTDPVGGSSGNVVGIAVGVTLLVLICIIAVIVFVIWKRRQRFGSGTKTVYNDTKIGQNNAAVEDIELNSARPTEMLSTDVETTVQPGGSSSSHLSVLPPLPENPHLLEDNLVAAEYEVAMEEGESWEITWDSLMLGKTILGEGNFGEVREGVVWQKDKVIKVAVKSLKDGASLMNEKDFMGEFDTMTKIGRHPNIVTLIGACKHEGVLYVALELIPHGNLRTCLRKIRKEGSYASKLEQLMKFAMDVANGMRHLEDIGIIHRDLAARNVLLGQDYVAKVLDFGLSRDEDIYTKKSKTRVPVRWMAPESVQFATYTTKSDVWSFGILLWEIGALGGTPYAKIDSKDLASMIRGGYRMPKPDRCADDMYEVMTNCWQFQADLRPTFRELHRTLSRMLEENQTYMTVEVYENVKLSPINTDRDDR